MDRGGPADIGGRLDVGDEILAVNGVAAAEKNIEAVLNNGEPGSKVSFFSRASRSRSVCVSLSSTRETRAGDAHKRIDMRGESIL